MRLSASGNSQLKSFNVRFMLFLRPLLHNHEGHGRCCPYCCCHRRQLLNGGDDASIWSMKHLTMRHQTELPLTFNWSTVEAAAILLTLPHCTAVARKQSQNTRDLHTRQRLDQQYKRFNTAPVPLKPPTRHSYSNTLPNNSKHCPFKSFRTSFTIHKS